MKKIIYICAKTFFYLFTFFFVFVLLFSILSLVEKHGILDVPYVDIIENDVDDFNAKIKIPIVNGIIKYQFSYTIVFMWLWLLFYSIYFYVLKDFFRIFIDNELFNAKSLNKLKIFFKLNFIPIILNIGIIVIGWTKKEKVSFEEEYFFIFIHSCVALLIYLYIDLFKKGRRLQEENNLTI
ncbi:hypothetical protein CXF68_04580 [Tenacibaculum sp. Bg11-29]|uniref:DUF2975 domain-containing protein n=1 Tax=Tenacibaculum sp. Bg11-29 TaxID=2058306 RepID=UPI000C33E186|nr:DUF2975 domain-containing protein [Tenacibaculum sp. Bg11-29]PKH50024.1 hypothetical protein CXF68_04580 [Tenacibaculum sp. Bg11-29]